MRRRDPPVRFPVVPPPGTDGALRYNRFPHPEGHNEETDLLYFAYTARIAPDKMTEVAPGAEFQFIAHLPEWGLEFSIAGNGWNGGLPTVIPSEGRTVWGAVFNVPDAETKALDVVEGSEQRVASTIDAIDRSGIRHRVVTHVYDGPPNGTLPPAPDYLRLMVQGSEHWDLPFGWIAGLEEHIDG
jgi:gamma-glutamylcyclotransferase (GGCT)/AIG2-like uncharacterized protein YtfP